MYVLPFIFLEPKQPTAGQSLIVVHMSPPSDLATLMFTEEVSWDSGDSGFLPLNDGCRDHITLLDQQWYCNHKLWLNSTMINLQTPGTEAAHRLVGMFYVQRLRPTKKSARPKPAPIGLPSIALLGCLFYDFGTSDFT